MKKEESAVDWKYQVSNYPTEGGREGNVAEVLLQKNRNRAKSGGNRGRESDMLIPAAIVQLA